MALNWDAVIKLGSGVLAAVVAWALKMWSERGAKVIAYYRHSSAITMPPTQASTGQEPTVVHTHSVVIRNVGRKAATNVRLSHFYLPPAFSLWPAVQYRVEPVQNSGEDVVIPTLVPNQEVTVNYLYFPPLLYTGVNSSVRTDEGFARIVNVLPTPEPSPWVVRSRTALMVVGVATAIYWVAIAIASLIKIRL